MVLEYTSQQSKSCVFLSRSKRVMLCLVTEKKSEKKKKKNEVAKL